LLNLNGRYIVHVRVLIKIDRYTHTQAFIDQSTVEYSVFASIAFRYVVSHL